MILCVELTAIAAYIPEPSMTDLSDTIIEVRILFCEGRVSLSKVTFYTEWRVLEAPILSHLCNLFLEIYHGFVNVLS
jgi:hypothetical protein